MLHELLITLCTNVTSFINPFTFTKDSHNYKILLETRKLEKFEIQLVKPRTTRSFNIRCPANKVTPKTLHVKWKGYKFKQAIIWKARCSFIYNRISVPISRSTTSKLKYLVPRHFHNINLMTKPLDLQNTIFSNK